MRTRRLAVTSIWLCALTLTSPARAIVGGDEAGADTRYDAIGALGFAARVGLDGPLPTPDDTWHCTATLIGPSLVLTARHCLFAGGAPVDPTTLALVFRRNPDGSLGATDPSAADRGLSSFHRVRASGMRVPDSGYDDVALVELAEPVTHIAPMRVALHGTALAEGSPIRLAGWGREGPTPSDPQTGLRTCDTVSNSWSGDLAHFPAASGSVCGPASHDSGGPILVRSSTGEERVVALVTATNFGQRLELVAGLPQLAALTHTPWGGADLSVDGYTHPLRYFRIGEEIELEVTMRNGGDERSGAAVLEISVSQPGAEPRRQVLHTEPLEGGMDAESVVTQAVRFRAPDDISQMMRRLAVRLSAAGDVVASNDEHLTPLEAARFYVVPRVLVYRDMYFAFLNDGDGIAGALAVLERSDGTAVALVTGPGRGVLREHGPLGPSRTLTLDAIGADGAALALGLTLPIRPVGDRMTAAEPIRAAPADISGVTSRDDRFANLAFSGAANPGAGRYEGTFLDGARESLSAIALPSRNVVLVIPELEAPNASFLIASPPAEEGLEWRASVSVPGSLTGQAVQRFDPALDQYIAEGTVTIDGAERPFLLVREASALGDDDPCHDDAECLAAGSLRCVPAEGRCSDEPLAGDAGVAPRDGGAPDAGSSRTDAEAPRDDAGSPVTADGGCSCRTSGRRRASSALALPLFALVALRRRRSRR